MSILSRDETVKKILNVICNCRKIYLWSFSWI